MKFGGYKHSDHSSHGNEPIMIGRDTDKKRMINLPIFPGKRNHLGVKIVVEINSTRHIQEVTF